MSDKADKVGFILRDTLAPYILEYANEKADEFGIVSVVDVRVSKDYSYADFFVTCTTNSDDLPKYLAKYA
jgi:ribosome-binding factor A